MSIIANISVGDILFYEVDSKPTHSAPKGSVAILNSDGLISLYKNNDGGTTWLKTIKPSYGELYLNNNTTQFAWNDYTLGSFYSFDSVSTWVADNVNGFIKRTDATFGDTLQYTGATNIRAVVKLRTTTRGGSGKWMEFEHTPALNFTVVSGATNGMHTLDNGGTNGVGCVTVFKLSNNDEVSVGFSPVRREGGGPANQRTFINRHAQLGVFKIDESNEFNIFSEDWESGGFTSGGWTVVNGLDYFELSWGGNSGDGEILIDGNVTTTSFDIDINNTALGYTKQSFPPGISVVYQGGNICHLFYTGNTAPTVTYNQTTANLQVTITEFTAEVNSWVIGTAQNNTPGGIYGAYISNDGASSTYDVNSLSVSHFYKDFTFPNGDITLMFDWKCQGENTAGNAVQYDYGTVVIADTTTTPVAGTEVSTTPATGGGNGRLGADTNDGKFNLGYGTTPGTTWNTETIDLSEYAGQTKRLIFSWSNDGSVGANPPFVVDNIIIDTLEW